MLLPKNFSKWIFFQLIYYLSSDIFIPSKATFLCDWSRNELEEKSFEITLFASHRNQADKLNENWAESLMYTFEFHIFGFWNIDFGRGNSIHRMSHDWWPYGIQLWLNATVEMFVEIHKTTRRAWIYVLETNEIQMMEKFNSEAFDLFIICF